PRLVGIPAHPPAVRRAKKHAVRRIAAKQLDVEPDQLLPAVLALKRVRIWIEPRHDATFGLDFLLRYHRISLSNATQLHHAGQWPRIKKASALPRLLHLTASAFAGKHRAPRA